MLVLALNVVFIYTYMWKEGGKIYVGFSLHISVYIWIERENWECLEATLVWTKYKGYKRNRWHQTTDMHGRTYFMHDVKSFTFM